MPTEIKTCTKVERLRKMTKNSNFKGLLKSTEHQRETKGYEDVPETVLALRAL